MRVQEINYEGNRLVADSKLKEVKITTGIHPDSLNTMRIVNDFEKIPYIKRASINVEPSGDLTVEITEQQPIAMLVGSGQKMYIDQEGIRLPINLGHSVDVPLLYGFNSGSIGDTLSGKSGKAAIAFLNELRKRPVSDATISEVAWTDNGIAAITNQSGLQLIFGDNNFSAELRNWEAFYSKVVKQKGIENMQSIDLRFKGQIVTREN